MTKLFLSLDDAVRVAELARIIAAADILGDTAEVIKKLDMRKIIKIDISAEFKGFFHISLGGNV